MDDRTKAKARLTELAERIAAKEAAAQPGRARHKALHEKYGTFVRARQSAEVEGRQGHRDHFEADQAARRAHEEMHLLNADIAPLEEAIAGMHRERVAAERFLEHVEAHHLEHVRTAAPQAWNWPEDPQ